MDENTTITSIDIGDVDAALAKSDAVVKGSIETTRQEHFYEETNIALVVPIGEDNEYKVYASTPNILMTQHNVSIDSDFKTNLLKIFPGCNVPWGSIQPGPSNVEKGKKTSCEGMQIIIGVFRLAATMVARWPDSSL